MSHCFSLIPGDPYIGELESNGTTVPARFVSVENRMLAVIRDEEMDLLKRLEREARFRKAFT